MRLLGRTLIVLVTGLIVGLSSPGVAGAADYFLRIDGIPGESRDREFQDAMEVVSWSWGMSTPRNGRPAPQDFAVTKRIDRASPLLFERVASGQLASTATLYVRTAGERPHRLLTLCFTDVRFSSIQQGGSAGDERPTEQLSFSYTTMVQAYRPQAADGSSGSAVFGGWDFVRNLRFGTGEC